MKTSKLTIAVLFLIFLSAFSSCKKEDLIWLFTRNANPQQVKDTINIPATNSLVLLLDSITVIQLGQTAINEKDNLRVSFDSLDNDSRCPEGVQCIWAGNASVSLSVVRYEKITNIKLNTGIEPKVYKTDNYSIELIDVKPHPAINIKIDPKGYTIAIRVTKKV
jgi:hypothetical protein